MQITDKILSIPPYLSTSWLNVSAIYMEAHPELSSPTLTICLKDGQKIHLPELEIELIEVIFENHARHLARDKIKTGISILQIPAKVSLTSWMPDWLSSIPNRALNESNEWEMFMKHNPEHNGVIPISDEILKRVMVLSKFILRSQDRDTLPTPEENCHCPHCLIAEAIRKGFEQNEHNVDEPITDADLHLSEWIIKAQGEERYEVQNSLEPTAIFTVSLRNPISCSCGQERCEHIALVLRT